MTVDWKLLVDVRERQQRSALEALARDRRAAEDSGAQAAQAQARLQARIDAKAAHWRGAASALAGGGCSMAELRQAGAWSGALDGRIAEAGRDVQAARAEHGRREQALQESRRRVQAAAGELEKARRMQQRSVQQRQRERESRLDDAAEEAAVAAWSARGAV